MAVKISINELVFFKNKNSNKNIGVYFSCWDLLHTGYHIFLEDSKNNCDILCVGLQTDPTIDRPEKNKPIQSIEEREIQLKSCRYVDYYFIYDTEESLYNTLTLLQPNIRFLGDDYIGKKFTGDDLPIKIFYHPRSQHTYSTTAFKQRINESVGQILEIKNVPQNKIYMTYKKTIPEKVRDRWTKLNPNYEIDLSLDSDCVFFLESQFNKYVSDLFISIKKGMYKADLWRLCKLYVNGGVYADVDLIPHLNIDNLDKDITLYSCIAIDNKSIFQAFMVHFSKPKNPLMFALLLSFLINNPYIYSNGPTYDMYNCIKYMLNVKTIEPEKKYTIYNVKINVKIGKSISNIKRIDLHYFQDNIEYTIYLHKNKYNDTFNFEIINNILMIRRIDTNTGWEHDHSIDICFNYTATVLFFKENSGLKKYIDCYVSFNNVKILDSRDIDYVKNGGW